MKLLTGNSNRTLAQAVASHLDLPLVGDVLYGGPQLSVSERALLGDEPEGYFLHAAQLSFPSPSPSPSLSQPERRIAVAAPLPPGRAALLCAYFPAAAAGLQASDPAAEKG